MRKLFHLALVLAGAFLFVPACHAQFTTVTATVTDPNGVPYVGAVMNAILVPGSSGGYTLGGKPYSGRIGPVTLDSTGSFTQNFGDVTLITPSGAQWAITIDSAAATIGLPLGTGPQSFTYTTTGTMVSGSSPVSLSTQLKAVAPNLTNISLSAILQRLTVTGPCTGAVSQFSFPTCVHITVAGLPATDISGLCIDDSNLAGQSICAVMKSNGQTEWLVGGNTSGVGGNCVADLEVNSGGNVITLSPVVGNPCDVDLATGNGNIHLVPGTLGNFVSLDKPIVSGGATFVFGTNITGTGVCLTSSIVVGGSWAGALGCTGTSGAGTITLTPGITASQGFSCHGSDITTPAAVVKQNTYTTTTCVLGITGGVNGDVIVFSIDAAF